MTYLFAGTSIDGSDGTRTRDLRRDRPRRAPPRPATDSSEQAHLQVLFVPTPHPSAWLSQSSRRRLGHEWATETCLHGQRNADARDVAGAACSAVRRRNSTPSLPSRLRGERMQLVAAVCK